MSKRKKKKEKKASPGAETAGKSQERHREIEAGHGMDFGGLPDRDLKKNLGCG